MTPPARLRRYSLARESDDPEVVRNRLGQIGTTEAEIIEILDDCSSCYEYESSSRR